MNRITRSRCLAAGMWSGVLLGCVLGFLLIVLCLPAETLPRSAQSGERWLLLAALVTLGTCLVAAPLIRYLDAGWHCRLDEFRNRIRDGAVLCYLAQFWEKRLDGRPQARGDRKAAEALFDEIYVGYNGRRAFAAPAILLLALSFISIALMAQSGIDACMAHRCVIADHEDGRAAVSLMTELQPTERFAPVGDIVLPLASAAALGGAFLFVIGDAILRARRCTTNVSDLYWYALRIALAIPMGLAFTELAARNVGALVAFGLGAFPIEALTKLLRRYTNKSIGGSAEEAQETDQLIRLDGVTVPIAAALAAEGVDSIDELVGVDPVLLAFRSGIPFPSVLRFASQAVVHIHLDHASADLVRIGLGNAYLVSQLVMALDEGRKPGNDPKPAEQRLDDAVAVLNAAARRNDQAAPPQSAASVEAAFRNIMHHGYTQFLLSVS
ncbi:MAG TPA: hypothetical protein VFN42_10220 [Acetobacteraceae bacterium]|nr:hypothetical protein [Acetobacteraceae bacterium]